ncbi:MAG: hypothetical protein E5V49_14120 [Mesorhizobium sp.]|nr:hypothetical protein EN848_09885 [bacterium M00.F.Ca.ET.205.01.1.1]TGU55734.1 hypothetical protein EN795_03140 [bacterium M00.F.Ca.ET.152.01.1.1]TGV39991.1 hypothetical protein EN829_001285 [Mesorhizobium sp. M00.F.Ca.ET.186.01.1.1]TGZ44974.1 hypothetical protein EN805_01280 [bacterium M00.F.Ca.ET.162.01.1.1]TIW60050.1 MAG: hypothetical protein E5V48_15410 [Mesorhizobium sp.]
MSLLAKARLSLALMISPGDLKGIVQIGLIIVICGLPIAAVLARQSSPITGIERDTGVVVNFVGVTSTRQGVDASGYPYLYGIRLARTGAIVFVNGKAGELLAVGSQVSVERQQRKNGAETYRLLES